jgi:cell division protein FtsZ
MNKNPRHQKIRNLLKGAGSVIVLFPGGKLEKPSNDESTFELDVATLRSDYARVALDMSMVARREWTKEVTTTRFKQSGIKSVDLFSKNSKQPNVKVIGVGGGGSNAIQFMLRSNIEGVEFICANTDTHSLALSSAHRTIQLGKTGLGAGSNPDKGQEAALASGEDIRGALLGTDLLFLVAGMGGGTGTGASPIIAQIAKEMGILTFAIVTTPFALEGGRRATNSDLGIVKLKKIADSLTVISNDKLLEIFGDEVTQDEAFVNANGIIKECVHSISSLICVPGNLSLDFDDVRSLLSLPGLAALGTGSASGPERAVMASKQAVSFLSTVFADIGMGSAMGVMVNITSAKGSIKLSESKLVMNVIRQLASDDAHVIYGASNDETMGDIIRVTVLVTGISQRSIDETSNSISSSWDESMISPTQSTNALLHKRAK